MAHEIHVLDADLVACDVLKKGTGGWKKSAFGQGILLPDGKLWLKGFKVIVLDIPLLFEAKMDTWRKPIIVVWVDPETQLQRLKCKNHIHAHNICIQVLTTITKELKFTFSNHRHGVHLCSCKHDH
ncbi:putative dephospho-CoA kinase [Rosa chinensis]|uniref:Putative dephospho-CoA kinase n=1 Tax=Rosa chinensis TaxID=74649 RepID=A0A2P6PMK2_ROSCH|nr:putative dephospho-CoA kinase [Rosa chinensis]